MKVIRDNPRATLTKIDYENKPAVRTDFKKINAEVFREMAKVMIGNPLAPEIFDMAILCHFTRPHYPYTLTEYLKAKPDADKKRLATRLALGLFDLWNQGYVHNDVHADNIFVTEGGVLFLGDWEHFYSKDPCMPFWESPDLIGGRHAHAWWDKDGEVDIGKILGFNAAFAVQCAREALVRQLNSSGGAYWERTSKGQIYGTIDVPGFYIEGRRDPKARLDQFNIDFKDKTVADLGCNAGSISFEAIDRGARHVRGFELINCRADTAQNIANFAGIDHRAQFVHFNFDEYDDIPGRPYDIVCAFAIDHQTQKPDLFYKRLYDATGETLLFETSKQPEFRGWCRKQLHEAGFGYVKYIGESSASDKKGRSRMCFVAEKQ